MESNEGSPPGSRFDDQAIVTVLPPDLSAAVTIEIAKSANSVFYGVVGSSISDRANLLARRSGQDSRHSPAMANRSGLEWRLEGDVGHSVTVGISGPDRSPTRVRSVASIRRPAELTQVPP